MQCALAVVRDTVAQNEVVHAAADVDRVDLHVAVMGEGGGDVRRGGVEQQRAAHEATGVSGPEAERGHSRRDDWQRGGKRNPVVATRREGRGGRSDTPGFSRRLAFPQYS